MSLKKQQQKAQTQVDIFNNKYPVGSKMYLIDDFGQQHLIETYAPARVLSCQAVGWAKGESKYFGCYLLDRFKPIST